MIHELVYLDTEINRGISTHPNKWVIFKTTRFKNGEQALANYIKETYPYIKLISAKTTKGLDKLKEKLISDYNIDNL